MIKVMLVEDDPMVREINFMFINRVNGFEVIHALAGINEAKKAVLEEKPDLILLDKFLTNENGLDFLRWLRSERFNVDVILITADKSSAAVQEAFRYGAVDYLVKPFTFERFSESLNQYKRRFESILCTNQVRQETIDKVILKHEKEGAVSKQKQLPKGLSCLTYNQILDYIINKNCEFTAEKLADEMGIARVTIRRYLEFMVTENKLELQVNYGKIGRPTHFYRLR